MLPCWFCWCCACYDCHETHLANDIHEFANVVCPIITLKKTNTQTPNPHSTLWQNNQQTLFSQDGRLSKDYYDHPSPKLTAVWITSLQMTDCTTLVLSRQSMQLMRKTPDWTQRGLVPLTTSSLDIEGNVRVKRGKEWKQKG